MSTKSNLRERLTEIGLRGEREMLAATGGVNTHRGAIWTLGLLCAARAMNDDTATIGELCAGAARIARLPTNASVALSHGRSVFLRFGARGARGEAEDGFPHVCNVALPALRASRALGHDEIHAQLNTLLHLIASIDDTCLLYRGGAEALHVAQTGAQVVLSAGITTAAGKAALAELDRKLLALNASPGGSADLLAATLLLDRFAPATEAA
jgi:triphosphoribosyl-dephospho-CoA synthase